MNTHTYLAEYRKNEALDSYDANAIRTAGGWDLINNDDEFVGFVLDGELTELELSGLKFHKFPFRGFGRLS